MKTNLNLQVFGRLSILLAVFTFLTSTATAQENNFKLLEFKEKSDYAKQEHLLKEMADYLLSKPLTNDENSKVIFANIMKWMTGTPDHQFVLDESITQLSKNNDDVLKLFMVSATKAALERQEKDAASLKLRSFEILLDYCSNKSMGIKSTKELKKATAAKDKGKLKEYFISKP